MIDRSRLAFLASSTVGAAWIVSCFVLPSSGAMDVSAHATAGLLPSPAASLGPLRIPERDPFAADVVLAKDDGSGENGPVGSTKPRSGSSSVGDVQVPDTRSFGRGESVGAQSNVSVVATMVGAGGSYALVEDGSAVRVVRVGEVLSGSRVSDISDAGVRLASGVLFKMSDGSSEVPDSRPRTALTQGGPPLGAPSTSTQTNVAVPYDRSSSPTSTVPGTAAAQQATPALDISGYGRPVLTNPDGTRPAPQATSNGTLFPSGLLAPAASSPVPVPSPVPVGGKL